MIQKESRTHNHRGAGAQQLSHDPLSAILLLLERRELYEDSGESFASVVDCPPETGWIGNILEANPKILKDPHILARFQSHVARYYLTTRAWTGKSWVSMNALALSDVITELMVFHDDTHGLQWLMSIMDMLLYFLTTLTYHTRNPLFACRIAQTMRGVLRMLRTHPPLAMNFDAANGREIFVNAYRYVTGKFGKIEGEIHESIFNSVVEVDRVRPFSLQQFLADNDLSQFLDVLVEKKVISLKELTLLDSTDLKNLGFPFGHGIRMQTAAKFRQALEKFSLKSLVPPPRRGGGAGSPRVRRR